MKIDVTKCKYKFQDEEKFDGKPYCTLQNELCEDISFACDTNCQVFEDYKQLHRYKQAIKDVKSLAIHLRGRCGQVVPYEVKQIIQKCEEVNK